MMNAKSLQDSVNKIIESQDKTCGTLREQLGQFGKTLESICRSLGTISHHIQNSNTTALHEDLVAMIRSEITSGVQEALLSTFSRMSDGGNPPPCSIPSSSTNQKPNLEKIIARDISSLKGDADTFFNLTENNGTCGPQPPHTKSQFPTFALNLRYRKYHRYETVFGVLLVFISDETTHWKMFPTSFHNRGDIFEAGFTFIPAPWLFKTAFAACFVKHANQSGKSSITTNLSCYAVVPDNGKNMEFSRSGNMKGIR
jgi:hypothetical protein